MDRLTDRGEGSGAAGDLRWCMIESLFRADRIVFAVTGTINLTRALPNLTRSVSIEGPGAELLTVRRDSGGNYRIFTVAPAATVSLSGLTISNGNTSCPPCLGVGGGIHNAGILTLNASSVTGNTSEGAGGGIFNTGRLTVSSSAVTGNRVPFGAPISGGGIYNERGGVTTVITSTISGNSANIGAGIFNEFGSPPATLTVTDSTILANTAGWGGGISNWGIATVTNSTISRNQSLSTDTFGGGGIFHTAGTLTVNNSTITGNSAGNPGGGGIYIPFPPGGSISVRNTIIAGNMAPRGPDVFGNLGSRGYNLLGNPQDASGWVATDILNVNPQLGPLQNNGGPTLTHALLPGSRAIDAGDNANAAPWDQRGPGFHRWPHRHRRLRGPGGAFPQFTRRPPASRGRWVMGRGSALHPGSAASVA